MQPKSAMLVIALVCMQLAASLSTTTQQLREAHRSERLNLLNHPLQIQLATGALPYGSFVRLCHDRSTILEAVRSAAAAAGADVLSAEVSEGEAKTLLDAAEAAGKREPGPPLAADAGLVPRINVLRPPAVDQSLAPQHKQASE